MERAAAVVVLTEHSRQAMVRRHPALAHRFHVIGNGVAPTGSPPEGWGWLRHSLGWGSGHRIVLFLGRMSREKNVEALAEAFAGLRRTLPAARLVLADPVADESAERAAAILEGEGLRHGVEYVLTGPVTPATREGLLADADVVALPSTAEQVPMVALEALARRVPVVASALPSMVEALRLDDREARLAIPVPLPPNAEHTGGTPPRRSRS